MKTRKLPANWSKMYIKALYVLFLIMEDRHFHAAALTLYHTRVDHRYLMSCYITSHLDQLDQEPDPKTFPTTLCDSEKSALYGILTECKREIERWYGMGYLKHILFEYYMQSDEKYDAIQDIINDLFILSLHDYCQQQ